MQLLLLRVFKALQKEIIRGISKKPLNTNSKGQTTRFFDRYCEDEIISSIRQRVKVKTIIISEELKSNLVLNKSLDTQVQYIIIDPVDGSDNYIANVPFVCMGVAVFDAAFVPLYSFTGNYYTGDYLYADRDKMILNGKLYQRPAPTGKKTALFTISGLKKREWRKAEKLKNVFDTVRSLGATIGEIMMVIKGDATAFADIRGRLTLENFAPFFLMSGYAGLIMTDKKGRKINIRGLSLAKGYDVLVSREKEIHKKLVRIFQ